VLATKPESMPCSVRSAMRRPDRCTEAGGIDFSAQGLWLCVVSEVLVLVSRVMKMRWQTTGRILVIFVSGVLCAGCATRDSGGILRSRVLRDLPRAVYGIDIDPNALLLSLDGEARLYCHGKETRTQDLETPATPASETEGRKANLSPILIEAAPSLQVRQLLPLLRALMDRKCTNIAILVSTAVGAKAVVLPVECDHGCGCLSFWDGSYRFDEHDAKEQRHVWIHCHVAEGGSLIVDRTRVGLRRGLVSSAELKEGGPRRPSSETVKTVPFEIATGPCNMARLAQVVRTPQADGLTVFVLLRVDVGTTVQDFLACLSVLEQDMSRRVVVELMLE
jgi:biopolymer transport protein ExbD